eukprot:scaffold49071_cov59-Phaeocystis_antarctica.AAC.14
MLAPVEVYASMSFIPGRSSCSNTACSALIVPPSVRFAPSATASWRTTWWFFQAVPGRRQRQKPHRPRRRPTTDRVLGAAVSPPAPVVCCRRPPAPCGRSKRQHSQGCLAENSGCSAARASPPRHPRVPSAPPP